MQSRESALLSTFVKNVEIEISERLFLPERGRMFPACGHKTCYQYSVTFLKFYSETIKRFIFFTQSASFTIHLGAPDEIIVTLFCA